MRKDYDFSAAKKNPYAAQPKGQITIRLDEESIPPAAPHVKRQSVKGEIVNEPTKLTELVDAFEWVSAGELFENTAYVHRESGRIYLASSENEVDEELPEDIEDDTLYLAVPNKRELDLGNRLALRFAEKLSPGSYELVDGYFHKKGAYARFKDLLDRQGRLEEWYQYEAMAVEQALREWCEENGLQLAP